MSDTLLILHVKGTEQETTALPKQVVRTAISKGELTHSQLIWSPAYNAWKQVREMPQLLPSQKLAPAPEPRVPTGALPKVVAAPQPQTGPVPRVVSSGTLPKVSAASRLQTGSVPRVVGSGSPPKVFSSKPQRVPGSKAGVNVPAVTTASRPSAEPAQGVASGNLVIKEDHGPHPLKWICIVLGVLILGALAVNYFLVSRSLTSGMSETPYANVMVYAHLGAFVQPNVVVIHVPASSALSEANLTDFLVTLAQNTPTMPLSHNLYERVALTSGWTGTYTITGYAWKELGDMGKDDESQRKEFLLDSLANAAGEPLMPSDSSLNDQTLQARRDQVWKEFVAQFIRS